MKDGDRKCMAMDSIPTSTSTISPINCTDLISEIHKMVVMCKGDCTTCQYYILKLINHIKTNHSGPTNDQEQVQKDTHSSTVTKTVKNRGNGLNPVLVLSEITSVTSFRNSFFVETPCPITGMKDEPIDPDPDMSNLDDHLFEFNIDPDPDLHPDPEYVSENYLVRMEENHNQICDESCSSDKCDLIDHEKNHTTENNSKENSHEPEDLEIDNETMNTTDDLIDSNINIHADVDLEDVSENISAHNKNETRDQSIHEKPKFITNYNLTNTSVKLPKKEKKTLKKWSEIVTSRQTRSQAGGKSYNCDHCEMTFTRADNLIAHQKSRTRKKLTPKKYKSEICKEIQIHSTELKLTQTRTKDGAYTCEECGRRFGRSDTFQRHLLMHTGFKPYDCKVCGRSYTRKHYLGIHERKHKHTGGKTSVTRGKNALTSLKSNNANEGNNRKSQEYSSSSLSKKEFIDKTVKLGHSSHTCSICHKVFSGNGLSRHMRTHTGEKPFQCDQCDKCYSRAESLMVHKRSHTGEKPYKCGECGKCYPVRVSLIRHSRSHTGEKPYGCDQCNKCYTRMESLAVHKRKHHTGEKPYACDQCNKGYTRRESLAVHKRTNHTGEKPYGCDQCNKSYTRRESLTVHKRTNHIGEKF